jgi:hypothetical protein
MGDTAPLDGLGVVGINSETDRMITRHGARGAGAIGDAER